jgi:hypothetical protein
MVVVADAAPDARLACMSVSEQPMKLLESLSDNYSDYVRIRVRMLNVSRL